MTRTQQTPVPNILVVDDTPANVQLLVRMLADRGYSVRAALSGELALQAARESPPDLILLDINMPGMNGYEVCEQLRADEILRDIPVIFLSALNETGDKVKAFSVGGVDYVTKPFQLDEVYARVETHLKLLRLQRQLNDHNESLELLVAQRTHELALAYERVQALSRLKNDFMSMISHEVRTPVNGVLGLGDLLINLSPPSDKRTRYASLFAQGSARLVNLLEDLSMIADIEAMTPKFRVASPFTELLAQVKKALPWVQISVTPSSAMEAFIIKGHLPLATKALCTAVLLGIAFSRNKGGVHLTGVVDGARLCIRLEVDSLSLSSEQLAEFFDLESRARSASAAESMGLAPVVAHQIITAFGGTMRLVKEAGAAGYLELILLRDQDHDWPVGGAV